MIRFALRCDQGHESESWFPSGASFDEQSKRGLVACSDCGSTRIGKAPMAPAVLGGRRAVEKATDQPQNVALLDERHAALREALRNVRREIEANTVDVGDDFSRAARAIHDGDEPERAIRGRAGPADVRSLLEDGVRVAPIPTLPDERN